MGIYKVNGQLVRATAEQIRDCCCDGNCPDDTGGCGTYTYGSVTCYQSGSEWHGTDVGPMYTTDVAIYCSGGSWMAHVVVTSTMTGCSYVIYPISDDTYSLGPARKAGSKRCPP